MTKFLHAPRFRDEIVVATGLRRIIITQEGAIPDPALLQPYRPTDGRFIVDLAWMTDDRVGVRYLAYKLEDDDVRSPGTRMVTGVQPVNFDAFQ